jgi:photosystem II stability/assembly factor-like uncharacterized protein
MVMAQRAVIRATLWTVAAGFVFPSVAMSHGGQPIVEALVFPGRAVSPDAAEVDSDEVWALTNNQGLYGGPPGSFRWLCEDAVVRNAGFQGLVVLDAEKRHWLVATSFGLYRTRDGGCTFEVLPEPLGSQVSLGLWQHPTRPLEVLVATQNPGEMGDDVWRTTNGGETFTPAGLGIVERARWFLRSEAEPERVYLAHSEGATRSEDGGATWTPITLGPEALDPVPEEFTLLGTHPSDPDEVWASIERFPDSTVLRSRDRGATWTPMFTVPDAPTGFAFAPDGRDVLVTTLFEGWRRSADGGDTWETTEETVALVGCLTRWPGSPTLWACSNVFIRGPWVVGKSEDLGRTFTAVLQRYQDISDVWACPADSTAAEQCAGLCPGQAAGAACDGADAGPSDDAGPENPVDGSVSVPLDAGPSTPLDVGTDGDGSGGDETGGGASSAGGCGVHPSPRSAHPLFGLGVCVGLALRRIRRSRSRLTARR